MPKSGISAAQHSKAYFLNNIKRAPVVGLAMFLALGGFPGSMTRSGAEPLGKFGSAVAASAPTTPWAARNAAARLSLFSYEARTAPNPVPLFFDVAAYPTGSALTVATGDFNGDGKLDLAVANSPGISVLLGNGNGTFQPYLDYPASGAISVAVGDFNGDGKLDLVTAGGGSHVSVLLGNGDGTFQAFMSYSTGPGSQPDFVAVGDLNGDGKLDLAVSNYGNSKVAVLLGNGDGTFQGYVDYKAGFSPVSIAIADLNDDGKLDLAVANAVSNTVGVMLGNGDGTFQAQKEYATGAGPGSVAVGDFNGDGKLDLVLANTDFGFGSSSISLLLGNGDGTFQAFVGYVAGQTPNWVSVGDFNGDGKLDVAVANHDANTVSVLLGNGDGTFQTHVDYAAGTQPAGLAVGNLNGGNAPDLVVTDSGSGEVSILINTSGTRVVLSSSPNPSTHGQTVTFTATVRATVKGAGTPTGTVTVITGSHVLGTATLLNGVAALTNAMLPIGSHRITAQYSGDSTFSPNTSRAIIQKVTP